MPTAKGKKKYHHGDLRTVVLEQAAKSISESGMDGLGLRSLAKDIGVSHAAVTYHFRDRQALLDAVAVQGFRLLGEQFSASVSDNDSDQSFRLIGAAYVNFAREHPGHFRVMFGRELMAAPPSDALRSSSQSALTTLTDAFEDPSKVVFAWGMVHGLANLLIYKQLPVTLALPSSAVDQLVEQALDRTFDALFTPPPIT